jgi:hypothetical protein
MADASDISAISALLKIAKDVEAKKLRRAQEDAALMVEEKEGRESLLSNRRGLERQLEDELEDSRKSANEEEEKKAQELTTRQDEEMISLKLKHIQARVQLVEENKAVRSHLMAIELARDSELVKEIEGKEKAFEATVQAKKEGLQAAREAEDENERATIQRNSTILTQLRGLWLPSQPVQTSSNTHSEFTTSPRAQGIPANNVNAQLHRGQLHGKNVDNNVHSDGTQRSVQGSPSNDDDRLARMELEIQRNKRQNEEVFGPYPTVTPPHGEKRPHVSEQSGAISNTPSSPATSASSASTLSCIVVENLQTPKRRRLESATNGEAMAATSPSPSTPTSTSRFGHAPQSANGIENTPGSASRFTVSTIRDALPTPSPTPSTPPSPSPAGGRLNNKGYLDIKINKYPRDQDSTKGLQILCRQRLFDFCSTDPK